MFKKDIKGQNFILLVASLLFYAWGEPLFVFAMLALIVINWGFGYLCLIVRGDETRPGKGSQRLIKPALILTLIANVGLLVVFKYADFITINANQILPFEIPVPQLALPIGISFFVFQAISYVVDIYRGTVQPQKKLSLVALYVSLFPQLMAGPIIRYQTIEKALTNRNFNKQDFTSGLQRFVVGLGKKVLIADIIAQAAEFAFGADPVIMSVSAAWLGAAAFGLQIYFDFSGYSDMAIGLGKMFGFHFLENFNFPYISRSITEFWRRWHISLGEWFKDYIYFPLGGSRVKSKVRLVFNLFVVWAFTGVWHGAAWTFIFWGLFFFVLIAFEKLTGFNKFTERVPILGHLYMHILVLVGWVLFRAQGAQHVIDYLLTMGGLNANPFIGFDTYRIVFEYWFTWVVGIIASIPISQMLMRSRFANKLSFNVLHWIYVIVIFLVSLVVMYGGESAPFIYFAF